MSNLPLFRASSHSRSQTSVAILWLSASEGLSAGEARVGLYNKRASASQAESWHTEVVGRTASRSAQDEESQRLHEFTPHAFTSRGSGKLPFSALPLYDSTQQCRAMDARSRPPQQAGNQGSSVDTAGPAILALQRGFQSQSRQCVERYRSSSGTDFDNSEIASPVLDPVSRFT